jgi:Holliday junction resolvasome RuvABC endonuclease subunit
MTNTIAGIDYSYTGPAMTIHTGTEWSLANCKIYFLTSTKKYQTSFYHGQIIGHEFQDYLTNEDRFDYISDFFLNQILTNKVSNTAIEGYSMASKGQVFTIGENTGLLKYKLYKENIPFVSYAPTHIKKYATTKGNCGKDEMYNAFLNENNVDMVKMLDYSKTKIESPVSDIIDSYFICKKLFEDQKVINTCEQK